jgi:MFS family permease
MASEEPQDGSPNGGVYAWYVVAVLMFAYMVAFVDRQILSLLVQPIKRDLGVTDTQIGLLAGFAFAIFYSVLGVPIARLADRTNRKTLITVGVVLWSLMTAACGLTKTYWQLFLMRVGVGVGEATLSPAAYSMMADYFPPKKLARAIGVYAMGLYMGAGVALLTGSAVVAMVSGEGAVEYPLVGELYPWQLTFFVVAIPGIVVLALLATVKEPPRRNFNADGTSSVTVPQPVPVKELRQFLRDNRRLVVSHLIGFLALGTVISAYLVWVPEFLRRTYDYSVPEAGVIFGLCLLIAGGAGPYFGGWFAEFLSRKGYRDAEMRASMFLAMAMIPFTALAPLAPSRTLAIVMLALAVFSMSSPQGLAPTIIQLFAPNRMRAQVTALFMLIAVLAGFSLGPYFVALLTDSLFRDESALNYSLAIVSGVLTPIGVVSLWYGLKPFGERHAE